jgi:hypothetical protein
MNQERKTVGVIALICLVVTLIWLALFIAGTAAEGAIESPEEALASVSLLGPLHYATYVNAALITVTATMLFAGLALVCWSEDKLWTAMASAFVPIYGLLNLFAYVSQITIVPRLAALRPAVDPLLAQLVQAWPGSMVNVLNNLGYAVLGIPSIIFGVLLPRTDGSLRAAGALLAASGVASLLGIIGIASASPVLSFGSIVSGVLFLAALAPMSVVWLRRGAEAA